MTKATDKVKEVVNNAAAKVKDAVSSEKSENKTDEGSESKSSSALDAKLKELDDNQEEQGTVTNDAHDYHPPGSGSLSELGVPERAASELKGRQTRGIPASTVSDSIPQPKIDGVVATVPYKQINPVADARSAARSQNSLDNLPATERKKATRKAKGQPDLSPTMIARLVSMRNNLDGEGFVEMEEVLTSLGLDENDIAEAEQLLKHPEIFAGDQKPANLQVLSLPPGAQKPREFEITPGMPTRPEDRYFPTRYASNPADKWFETGDIVYHVHEDQTFTVLSAVQQTSEWQAVHHTPPMNVIRRIGGKQFAEIPEPVLRSGQQLEREEAIQ